VVTMLSVAVGLCGGSRIGRRFGRPSEIAGGIVLILIGLNMLLGIV
jgi:putative Mn2+ efflux pump MntP